MKTSISPPVSSSRDAAAAPPSTFVSVTGCDYVSGQANNDAAGGKKSTLRMQLQCVCTQLKEGPGQPLLLFYFIVQAVQITAPESMSEKILKRTELIYLEMWSFPLIQWLTDRNMQIGT